MNNTVLTLVIFLQPEELVGFVSEEDASII